MSNILITFGFNSPQLAAFVIVSEAWRSSATRKTLDCRVARLRQNYGAAPRNDVIPCCLRRGSSLRFRPDKALNEIILEGGFIFIEVWPVIAN